VYKRQVKAISQLDSVRDVRSNLSRGYPEIHIRLDRDALAVQTLNARAVAQAVQQQVLGQSPTSLSTGERRVDIVVRLDRSAVRDRDDLENLVVSPGGIDKPSIALAEVSRLSPPTEGPSEIRRIEGQRVAVVEAVPQGLDLTTALADIEETLAGLSLPRNMQVRIAGQSAELETAQRSLLLALALAVFLVSS